MRKLLTIFSCFLCLVLNTSMSRADFLKKSEIPAHRLDKLDVPETSGPCFARFIRFPKGAVRNTPKSAPKPKTQPVNNNKTAPKGSHDNNKRESNREKHENADARRQKEQKKAEEKREQNKKR